ncbi:hypothetical protein WDU94_009098 [Cyamophila willieti]
MSVSLEDIKFAREEEKEEEMEVGQDDEEVEGEESLTVLLNNSEQPSTNMGKFSFISIYIFISFHYSIFCLLRRNFSSITLLF